MALSANSNRTYEGMCAPNSLPVKATSTIYLGSAVGLTAGYARALVAADPFQGFADEKIVGTSADGGIRVPVVAKGEILGTFSAVAVTDVGADCYMSDDDTFTTTATNNSFVGKIIRYVSTTTAVVAFDATKNP